MQCRIPQPNIQLIVRISFSVIFINNFRGGNNIYTPIIYSNFISCSSITTQMSEYIIITQYRWNTMMRNSLNMITQIYIDRHAHNAKKSTLLPTTICHQRLFLPGNNKLIGDRFHCNTSIFTLCAPHEEVQGRQTKPYPGFTLGKLVQPSPGTGISFL